MTEALETFAFNFAVARIHELANAIGDGRGRARAPGMDAARREALEALARLSAPMMPHLAEEMWALLRAGRRGAGGGTALAGGRPGAARGGDGDAGGAGARQAARHDRGAGRRGRRPTVFALAEAEENVQRAIGGRPVRKRIHVPGRVVNFVV